MNALRYAAAHWRDAVEILLLAAAIYYAWLSFRRTRGAKALTGMAMIFIGMVLVSQFLELPVINYLFRNISTFLVFALVVIFQPELRRALAAIGSHRWFASATQSQETVEKLTELTFDLANRQLGALVALERDTSIESFGESGVEIDSKLSPELVVSLFFPKTPLHDGGAIVRNDRVLFAACTFPVTQRTDLDRTLGMRHRAALGLAEESDAVVIVVSEETGIVSLCHRGTIERNFDPETFKRRLSELLLLEGGGRVPQTAGGGRARSSLAEHSASSEASKDDRLAF